MIVTAVLKPYHTQYAAFYLQSKGYKDKPKKKSQFLLKKGMTSAKSAVTMDDTLCDLLAFATRSDPQCESGNLHLGSTGHQRSWLTGLGRGAYTPDIERHRRACS